MASNVWKKPAKHHYIFSNVWKNVGGLCGFLRHLGLFFLGESGIVPHF